VLPQPAGRLPGKQEEARVIVPATIEQLNELREERKGFRR
jgi:hypothetical protein